MRHFLLGHTLVLLCLSYSPVAQSQLQKIYLHPKAAGNEKQSKIIDSIRFIPLEIKEGIELASYTSVEPTANYFLLRDYSARTILLYGRDGRFIKKINYRKLGESFYPSYDERKNQIVFFGNNKNYSLTPRDRIKIRLDWSNPRNKRYYKKYTIDLSDTAFVITKAIPEQKDIIYAQHCFDDYYGRGQVSTSELYKDSLDYELNIYKGNQLVKSYFPYNRINEPKFLYTEENVAIYKTDTPYINMVTRPFCDTVYRMEKDSLVPGYQIVLPLENSLPASFFTKPFKNKTERENFRRNNGWMLRQIYGFYETPRFIYFMIGYLSNYEAYIYQKKTNTTVKTKNIKADSSQYNLQLLGDFGVTQKKDKFYKTLKSGDILTFFEKNKNVPVPKELESFIKNSPPATTSVIIEFKLKN
jgi:hypothetical protein